MNGLHNDGLEEKNKTKKPNNLSLKMGSASSLISFQAQYVNQSKAVSAKVYHDCYLSFCIHLSS